MSPASTSVPFRRTEPIEEVAPERCPRCATARASSDRFCEGCGVDLEALTTAPIVWSVEVMVDRDHFERVAPSALEFPAERPTAHFTLGDRPIVLGRRRPGQPDPDIDLSDDLADPGVSSRHAAIATTPDGPTVTDLRSTNGTTINDDRDQIPPSVAIALAEGDQIHLGAWTTITVRARRA